MEKKIIKFPSRAGADSFKEWMRKVAPGAFVQVCFMRSKYCATVTNATDEQIQEALGKSK